MELEHNVEIHPHFFMGDCVQVMPRIQMKVSVCFLLVVGNAVKFSPPCSRKRGEREFPLRSQEQNQQ